MQSSKLKFQLLLFIYFLRSIIYQKISFLNTLKANVLGFQKLSPCHSSPQKALSPPRQTHKRGASSGAILVSPIKHNSVFSDSVYYIGKVNLSQQQAPPQLIDRVLVHLKKTNNDNEVLQMPTKNMMKKRYSLDLSDGIGSTGKIETSYSFNPYFFF